MATAAIKYQQLLDSVFGVGVCQIKTTNADRNVVTDAIAAASDYSQFSMNFTARLKRLAKAYRGHKSENELLNLAKLVNDCQNWQGAIAELAALDFYISDTNWLIEPPNINISIDPSQSLASRFGLQEANLDLHFAEPDVYSDVKVLKDNVNEILDGVFARVWPTHLPHILPSYPRDGNFKVLQQNRGAIEQFLQTETANSSQPTYIDCGSIVPELSIRLLWGPGTLIADSSYSPYRHAKEHEFLPFLHAKKFVTSRPFILTFVTFPWFNNTIQSHGETNKIFYRSLSRRVFCRYRFDSVKYATMFENYNGSESLYDVSRCLDGILFLEDNAILGNDPNSVNVRGYLYENPNSHQKLSMTTFEEHLRAIVNGDRDDFVHDNY